MSGEYDDNAIEILCTQVSEIDRLGEALASAENESWSDEQRVIAEIVQNSAKSLLNHLTQ